MKVGVVLVCAGKGKRLGKADKTTLKLGASPPFVHALKAFKGISNIKQIVLVLRKDHFSFARRKLKTKKITLVEGGRQRKDSVYNGLCALDKAIDYVLIHDGARPFISKEVVNRILKELKKHPAVICGLRAKDTVKLVDSKNFVRKTLDRNNIFLVQTPQGFKRDLILKAYKKIKRKNLFDDAQILELIRKKVKIVEGDIFNFKITYPKDYILAKGLANERL